MKRLWKAAIPLMLIILAVALFILVNRIPGKYAVKEDEFKSYGPYILIKEVHYTGTGWVQVGNEGGHFSPEAYEDVHLVNGTILPQMEMYNEDYANTFLCRVEHQGQVGNDALGKQMESYYIVEWYPVHPILRDTMLPDWVYPKDYMTKWEVK